jgi:hypothetical protein
MFVASHLTGRTWDNLVGATGFEPVTHRLQGVTEPSGDVACLRLKRQLAGMAV